MYNNIIYKKLIFSREYYLILAILFFLFLFSLFSYVDYAVFGVVILLFFAILYFAFYPVAGISLMALFLPLTYVVLDFSISRNIPIIDALAMIVFVGFVFRYFILKYLFGLKILNLKYPVWIPFVVFFTIVMFSNLLSGDSFASAWYALRNILFFYIFYLWLPVNIILENKKESSQRLSYSVLFFSLSAIFLSLLSFLNFIYSIKYLEDENYRLRLASESVQAKIMGLVDSVSMGLLSVQPYLTEHVLLVETLLPGVFFLLALKFWFDKNEKINRIINFLILFVFCVLIGTFSRGGWLGVLVGFVIYSFFNKKRIMEYLIMLMLLFSISLPIVFHMYDLQTDYKVGGSSNKNRLMSLDIAFESFQEKPFFGHGSGQYVEIINSNIEYIANFGNAVDALGVVQKIIVENGMLGLISFMFFVLSIFMEMYRETKKSQARIVPILTLSIGAFCILFFEFFNTSYFMGRTWLPIGLALSAVYITKEYEKK